MSTSKGKKRVVITGLGPITPVGTGREEVWEALAQGRNGIGPVQSFCAADYPSRMAGEVLGFSPEEWLGKREARRVDRFAHFALIGARLALEDAGLKPEQLEREQCAVILGTGIGGLITFQDQVRVMLERGPDRVSPYFIPMMIANMGAGQVAIDLGFRGPSQTVVTACASGTDAMGWALRLLQEDRAQVVVTGGTEASVCPMGLAGFCAMKALSTRNEEPEQASRPFDRQRDGFVMGEGAGILIFESLEHARNRGAKPLAEVLGYGATCDAYHVTAPDPEGDGAVGAMTEALKDAGLEPEQVSYINAHGTSTPYNDLSETRAIKTVFGSHARKLAISSTKSMMGHLLGAAGGVEMIATCLALDRGIVHPTINYQDPDPDCDLDYVPNEARHLEVAYAMSNSFGFGGHNATLVVGQTSAE